MDIKVYNLTPKCSIREYEELLLNYTSSINNNSIDQRNMNNDKKINSSILHSISNTNYNNTNDEIDYSWFAGKHTTSNLIIYKTPLQGWNTLTVDAEKDK